ncbi:MAG: hypothetical protein J0H08_05360 [Rhizobiales bacterium]|nr:hypothetical protein [Hyphomicrobiales bacterium]
MALLLGSQNADIIGFGETTDNADTVYGLNGNDAIKGIGGADSLYGGLGSDTILGGDSDDEISGDDGTDALRGDAGNDTIYGGDGTDRLEGSDGDDVLFGGAGDERGGITAPDSVGSLVSYEGGLFGGDGNDEIYGGSGNDDLTGGLGTDAMYGGKGQDTFFFASIEEIGKGKTGDLIGDFRHKDGDLIDLSAIDAKAGGNDNKFKYIGDDGFHGKKGELQYKNGKLSGDTDGDGKADFKMFVNTDKMVADDFVL